MRPPTNQQTTNVYMTRIPETGDFSIALQILQLSIFIILLMFIKHEARTYRHRRVVEDTNMKKYL